MSEKTELIHFYEELSKNNFFCAGDNFYIKYEGKLLNYEDALSYADLNRSRLPTIEELKLISSYSNAFQGLKVWSSLLIHDQVLCFDFDKTETVDYVSQCNLNYTLLVADDIANKM